MTELLDNIAYIYDLMVHKYNKIQMGLLYAIRSMGRDSSEIEYLCVLTIDVWVGFAARKLMSWSNSKTYFYWQIDIP